VLQKCQDPKVEVKEEEDSSRFSGETKNFDCSPKRKGGETIQNNLFLLRNVPLQEPATLFKEKEKRGTDSWPSHLHGKGMLQGRIARQRRESSPKKKNAAHRKGRVPRPPKKGKKEEREVRRDIIAGLKGGRKEGHCKKKEDKMAWY